jgi:4,5-DOPA dioxygenase extradiol
MRQPALFLSHGSPMIVLDESPARTFLEGLSGQLFVQPDAILLFSAHHDKDIASVTASARPETIHDFGGFPDALYAMHYPAAGSPALAAQVAQLLNNAGIASVLDDQRGFDHGAWTPMMLAWPHANIPMVQLSINSRQPPDYHYRLGQAVAPLRDRNILIVGSGAMTHNLQAFFRGGFAATADAESWVTQFTDWVDATLLAGDVDTLLRMKALAPFSIDNHPTDEHILPLFVAMGAAGRDLKATKMHSSVDHAVLAMDAWRFD